jgi:NAD(P)-dependent dehydrogenase (short-subunit alcohol dehydrogenase family)
MTSKTWFITGTSRGFGREWTKAALDRGDRVAATARDASTLDDLKADHDDALLALPLDVTDRDAAFGAVSQAHEHFGRLDVVVNNAGYGHFGMVEEISETETRARIETNLFGALWITQAALPFLRRQGTGHIVQVSSIGGISAFPGVGIYHASKWALEGISQALAQEVKEFGINLTLVEPAGFSTDWSGPSAKRSDPNPAYDGLRDRQQQWRASNVPGDPTASAEAIMRVVDADRPPLRVFFGTTPLGIAEADYETRLATWRDWQPVAELAQGATLSP